MTRKLFGTDGIRGTANREPITPETALAVAKAAGVEFLRGDHRQAVKTLERLLPELDARGYSLVTLSELDRVVQRAEPD